MHDLVFMQRQPTQIDAPLFRSLLNLGVDVHAMFRSAEAPFDPELGRPPDFGRVLDGYPWSLYSSSSTDVPRARHIVTSGWDATWSMKALITARRRGASAGVRFDSVLPGAPGGASRRFESLRRGRALIALSTASIWHPVGSYSSEFADSFYPLQRPQVAVPYAAEVQLFSSLKPERNVDGQLRILVVAKLAQRENVEPVVRATSVSPGFHLTIVGDGPDRSRLECLALQLGISHQFLGYQPYHNLPRLFRESDIFVHPPLQEVWGVSVHEAMVSGLPVVVSTEVGSARDLLGDARGQVSFAPYDFRALAGILKQFQDPKLRSSVGEANRRKGLELTPEKTAESLVALLDRLPV